jgi:hypothetical protein
MSKQSFDEAIRRSDILDGTLKDRNVNLALRNLPANFAYDCNTVAGSFEAPFLPLRQLPSSPLGVSGLTPLPTARLANYLHPPAAWKNSDDFLLAAVEAERRSLAEVSDALIGKRQMATQEAQEKHALLRLSFLQSAQPMQTMTPLAAPARLVSTGNKLCQAETPATSTKVVKALAWEERSEHGRYQAPGHHRTGTPRDFWWRPLTAPTTGNKRQAETPATTSSKVSKARGSSLSGKSDPNMDKAETPATTSTKVSKARGSSLRGKSDPNMDTAETPATTSTKVSKVWGSSLRGKSDPNMDASKLPVIAGQDQTIHGVADQFPLKLYFMLLDAEKQGKSNIVSFSSDGSAFAIHDMKAFMEDILPTYFFAKQSKLVSFVRQVNLFGFVRIRSGLNQGGFYHELFKKGRPELLAYMLRTDAPKGKEDRCKTKKDRRILVDYATKPSRLGQPPPAA